MEFGLLLRNYPLLAAATAWASAQSIKVIIKLIITGKFDVERLFGAGGMPSAHSATVCALVVAVSRMEGPASSAFAIMVIFAFIVMHDAMGVRRAAGEQAKRINLLLAKIKTAESGADKNNEGADITSEVTAAQEFINELDLENDEWLPEKELKEHIGHTPLEVLGGALLGIIVAMLIRI